MSLRPVLANFHPPLRMLLLAAFVLLGSALAGAGTLQRGPYIQQATSDSVVVVWRTTGPAQPSVRFGAAADALTQEAAAEQIVTRVSVDVAGADALPKLYAEPAEDRAEREKDGKDRDPSTPADTWQYEARITGLSPATQYYYAVFDGGTMLAGNHESYYFKTLPPVGPAAPMRIWVVGDSGTGGVAQKRVHTAMQDFTKKTKRPLDQYIHVGDMAYGDGTDFQFQRNFFEIYDETLRNTVCWPSMGNHEGHTSRGQTGFGPYYDAYVVPAKGEGGGVASGTEAYYAFDIGHVHFICLDSHDLDRTPGGAMYRWLQADLEQVKAEILIAFWHHPPYTKGSHDSDREGQLIEMREHIMPILEEGGVDVVLTGHSHIYERSMLMDGAYVTPTTAEGVILDDGDGNPEGDGPYRKSAGLHPHEGTVQVVAGHGGASLGRQGTMPVMREIILDHGSVVLDIDGAQITGTMIDKEGATRDLFRVEKSGTVTVERVAQPWQPVHDPGLLSEFSIDFAKDEDGDSPVAFELESELDAVAWSYPSAPNAPKVKLAQVDATKAAAPVVAVYEPFKSAAFEAKMNVYFGENGAGQAGMLLCYQDTKHFYYLQADVAGQKLRLIKYAGGEPQVLREVTAELKRGERVALEARMDQGTFAAQAPGAALVYKDEAPLSAGEFGFRIEPGAHLQLGAFDIEK
ncbi:MAG: metallophosphoesterase family protein [Candidatus Hydrogenedentes bacterium]|nr:metallophosphoesterase family protein [Candidatus Hydrogenedentota bacterium]